MSPASRCSPFVVPVVSGTAKIGCATRCDDCPASSLAGFKFGSSEHRQESLCYLAAEEVGLEDEIQDAIGEQAEVDGA